jgi:selenide, water dikinase
MNIVCFSPKTYDLAILKEIIRGGADKMREAGVSLLGGHSVDDPEIKYGLSVTGIVHPDKIMRNEGALAGDLLIITKPLGTGILNTGMKAGELSAETTQRLISVMAALNRDGAEVMRAVRTHAATDVTGFGLVGHLSEMIKQDIGIRLFSDHLPYFEEAVALAASGFVPAGLYRNRDFYKSWVENIPQGFMGDIIFDPQTSGGLLIAVDSRDVDAFADEAKRLCLTHWVIGEFIDSPKAKIVF